MKFGALAASVALLGAVAVLAPTSSRSSALPQADFEDVNLTATVGILEQDISNFLNDIGYNEFPGSAEQLAKSLVVDFDAVLGNITQISSLLPLLEPLVDAAENSFDSLGEAQAAADLGSIYADLVSLY